MPERNAPKLPPPRQNVAAAESFGRPQSPSRSDDVGQLPVGRQQDERRLQLSHSGGGSLPGSVRPGPWAASSLSVHITMMMEAECMHARRCSGSRDRPRRCAAAAEKMGALVDY